MRRLTLLVILVLVAACGTSASSMSPAPTAESLVPGAENPPTKASDAQATDIDGRFQLNFSLPQASYRTTDAITGEAALSVTDGKDARIGGPGAGPLGFTFVEVAGTRRMEAGWDLSCGSFTLRTGSPMTGGITKSGGWSADEPNAPFYQAFFADPEVHLPAGTWDISGRAWFSEGECGGPSHDMTATIRVTVAP